MSMKLKEYFTNVTNNTTITLEKEEYHIYPEDAFHLSGFYCSNTATEEENPNGERFSVFYLENKKNITIDGNGATIIIHGIMTPFLLRNCENICFRNLTVDYHRPTMSEFFVAERNGDTAVFDIDKQFPFEIKEDQLIWKGENWQHAYKGDGILSMYYQPDTEYCKFLKRDPGDMFPSVPTIEKAELMADGRVAVTFKNKAAFLPQGCIVQTRDVARKQLGGFFERCKNVVLENLRIKSMHGFGLLFQFCKNTTLNGLDCTPAQGRTIASNADFFHFSGCNGFIKIENCKAAGAHDDFVNVHGTYLEVVKKEKDGVVVRFMNPSTWGFQAFSKKDKISFANKKTMIPHYQTEVLEYKRKGNKEIYLVLKDFNAQSIDVGDVVDNLSAYPEVYIQQNTFGPSMGRGILCTTHKKTVIKNNVFYKVGGTVLLLAGDCNYWFESGRCGEVIFENNVLDACGYGVAEKATTLFYVDPVVLEKTPNSYYHRKLVIKKNKIKNEIDNNFGVMAHDIQEIVLSDNK